ncbi:hypothetical protein [Geomonas subterranea]|uniref:hypothetical protein n=1 Tax=Geomonas subterranea TaxID=2847989 RepID=UPI001CD27DA0|nr:hypothetical protein [Geomonas fuzhouensis]
MPDPAPLPELGLHRDIGHTELMLKTSSADEIIERFGSRLAHVHLHDNKGGTPTSTSPSAGRTAGKANPPPHPFCAQPR